MTAVQLTARKWHKALATLQVYSTYRCPPEKSQFDPGPVHINHIFLADKQIFEAMAQPSSI